MSTTDRIKLAASLIIFTSLYFYLWLAFAKRGGRK